MVRVNIIEPWKLSDQHLIAEYLEIIMLVEHARNYPSVDEIPSSYRLGEGHIKFFKNKIFYLKRRHEEIRKEMKRRGFATNKKISLTGIKGKLKNDWSPTEKDFKIIRKRIVDKINIRPCWYRYYGERKNAKFFIKLINK